MRTYKRPKSVKELREEFEAIVTKTKQTRDRVDSVQAAARKIREQYGFKGSAGATHREDDRYGGPV